MDIPLNFAWLEAAGLAAARITAFLVVAPPFSHGAIPMRVKAMLAVGLALAVGVRVAGDYEPLGTWAFIAALTLQILTGALLGFLVLIAFSAVQAAGSLIDLFGGFQIAMAFDPQSNVNGAQFTRLFQLTAFVLLFASGAYQIVIAGLVRSFDAVPIDGEFAPGSVGSVLTDAIGQMLLAAVQVAGPLALILFLADAALGLIGRVAPALNIFALGFPMKIILTLALAGAVFVTLPAVVNAVTDTGFGWMGEVRP